MEFESDAPDTISDAPVKMHLHQEADHITCEDEDSVGWEKGVGLDRQLGADSDIEQMQTISDQGNFGLTKLLMLVGINK